MEIKERIINGTLDMMGQVGLKNTTMDSLAKQLGISKRTIYENFEDKHKLIEACVAKIIEFQNIEHQNIKAQSNDMLEEMFNMLTVINKNYETRGKITWEIKRNYPDLFEDLLMEHYKNTYDRMTQNIEEGIKQKLILEKVNIKFAVYTIMTTIHSLMINPEKLFQSTNVSTVDSFKYVIIYFFRGIATTKGIKKIEKLIEQHNIH